MRPRAGGRPDRYLPAAAFASARAETGARQNLRRIRFRPAAGILFVRDVYGSLAAMKSDACTSGQPE